VKIRWGRPDYGNPKITCQRFASPHPVVSTVLPFAVAYVEERACSRQGVALSLLSQSYQLPQTKGEDTLRTAFVSVVEPQGAHARGQRNLFASRSLPLNCNRALPLSPPCNPTCPIPLFKHFEPQHGFTHVNVACLPSVCELIVNSLSVTVVDSIAELNNSSLCFIRTLPGTFYLGHL
jgi:hypothetical protein